MSYPIGFFRALLILMRLRLLTAIRFYPALTRRVAKKGARTGTARKSAGGIAWAILLFGFVFLQFIVIASSIVTSIDDSFGRELPPVTRDAGRQKVVSSTAVSLRTLEAIRRARPPPDPEVRRVFGSHERPKLPLRGRLAFSSEALKALSVLFMAALLLVLTEGLAPLVMNIQDPEREWLATLPIPPSTLHSYRLLQRAVPRLTDIGVILPFSLVIAWVAGMRWAAPLAALLTTACLMLAEGTLTIPLQTALRFKSSQETRSRVTGLCFLLSLSVTIGLFVVLQELDSNPNHPVLLWMRHLPEWVLWTPPGLAATVLASPTLLTGLMPLSVLALQTLFLGFLSTRAIALLSVEGTSPESGCAGRLAPSSLHTAGSLFQSVTRTVLSPATAIVLRNAKAPGTIRKIAGTIIVVCGVLLALGFVATGPTIFTDVRQLIASIIESPRVVLLLAFGVPVYIAMLSGVTLMPATGPAIWILYAVPRSTESLLRGVAGAVGTGTALMTAAITVLCVASGTPVTCDFVVSAALGLVGSFSIAFASVCLGFVNSDPTAEDPRDRVNSSAAMICLLLLYGCGASTATGLLWQQVANLVLLGAVLFAVWQKAVDYIPFVLDPVARPPERVSLADGLIAVQIFLMVQVFAVFGAGSTDRAHLATTLFGAFCLAGAVAWGWMHFAIWHSGFVGRPKILGGGWPGVREGLWRGLQAALVGVVYLGLLVDTRFRNVVVMATDDLTLEGRVGFLLLGVLAAPLFEEFLFRGLVFGGMRRTTGFWPAALASSLLFALCHPPAACPAVFVLGVLLCLAYERTGRLLAPMVAHALYNLIVLGIQL